MSSNSQSLSVRVPRVNDQKSYSILKFNENLRVDITSWANSEVQLEREDNRSTALANVSVQDFGEGSEYGRAAREEARRKKYGRQSRSYRLDNQPWKLAITDEENKTRQFRSIREGGAGEHADYWVFIKDDNEFNAYKIDSWHNMLNAVTHKTLDIDQAEEQFLNRSKVMNQFALKAQIQKQLGEGDEELDKGVKLKIKDNFSDTEGSDADDERDKEKEEEDDDDGRLGKKKPAAKKKKVTREKKDKRVRVKESDEVAKYESEDGEEDGQEVDYMSDSGSDSDRDMETNEEKVEKAMVSVLEEDGLKKFISSDEEENDDDEDILKRKAKEHDKGSSESEFDGDEEKTTSVFLLPAVKAKLEQGQDSSSAKKRALEDATAKVDAKKPKLDLAVTVSKPPANAALEDILTVASVRRCLERNPHTTKDLVSKFRAKCANFEKTKVVAHLAKILKEIQPNQFRKKQGNKEVLYFSMQPSN